MPSADHSLQVQGYPQAQIWTQMFLILLQCFEVFVREDQNSDLPFIFELWCSPHEHFSL